MITVINHEAVCKVIHAVSNRKLTPEEKVTRLIDARRFIIAWGINRGHQDLAMTFLANDSMLKFAQSVG